MSSLPPTVKPVTDSEKKRLLSNLKIFSGNANRKLAEDICAYIADITQSNFTLGEVEVKRFSDGEVFVKIKENVRNQDVFIIQPTSKPVNEHLMELLVMIDAARRASAASITAVIPYYGYARQDRKAEPRTPISAKLVASLLETAGVDRMISVDLHANQIQGFFHVPVDNLYAARNLTDHYRNMYHIPDPADMPHDYVNNDVVMVSPDAGGATRCRAYSKRLRCPMAIIDKRRPAPNQVEVTNVIGDVEGKDVILLDDMVDTAGSICSAAAFLKDRGAKRIEACVTHGVLSGPAIERINESAIERLVITDTILQAERIKPTKSRSYPSLPCWARQSERLKPTPPSAVCSIPKIIKNKRKA